MSPMLTQSQRDSLEQATQMYQHEVGLAAAYLAGRGLSEETVRTYRLGVVTPTNAQLGDEQYCGRLTIPFTAGDEMQSVVGMRFRSLHGEEPKYLSRVGDETTMFSVQSLNRLNGTVVITEGEIDCMTLNQCGIPSVGVTGAKAFKPHYRLLLQDCRVLIACDGDQAGRDFGKHIAEIVQGAVPVSMPDGEDVNSVYTTHGESELRRLLRLSDG